MSLVDAQPVVSIAQCGENEAVDGSVNGATKGMGWRDGRLALRLQGVHAPAARVVRVAWRLHGPADAPCVAVLGGISADRQVAGEGGWWNGQTRHGAALDAARWRILSFDWIDADDVEAPAVETIDQASVLAGILDALGISRLHALVGSSYGAMVGLAFAAAHPRKIERLIAIAGAHRAHPQASALRAIQRNIVRLAGAHGDVGTGLALARQLAMIGYRSPREMGKRFRSAPVLGVEGVRVASQDWMEEAGRRFTRYFSASRFISLSESIDLHRIDPTEVRVPSTLIGFNTDQLVPVADLCALQAGLGARCELHVLDSDYGHDAFLKEHSAMGHVLEAALRESA